MLVHASHISLSQIMPSNLIMATDNHMVDCTSINLFLSYGYLENRDLAYILL